MAILCSNTLQQCSAAMLYDNTPGNVLRPESVTENYADIHIVFETGLSSLYVIVVSVHTVRQTEAGTG